MSRRELPLAPGVGPGSGATSQAPAEEKMP